MGSVLQPAADLGAVAVRGELRARLAFVLLSKLYRQMYANTGIATDSARVNRANRWARLIAGPVGICLSRVRCLTFNSPHGDRDG